MGHSEVCRLRAGGCAGGHGMANAALNCVPYINTSSLQSSQAQEVPGLPALAGEETSINLTSMETLPIVPLKYLEQKGPSGTWADDACDWSWRKYNAELPDDLYNKLFGDRNILEFHVRAVNGCPCPFPTRTAFAGSSRSCSTTAPLSASPGQERQVPLIRGHQKRTSRTQRVL